MLLNASFLQFSRTPIFSLLVRKHHFPFTGVLQDEVMGSFPALAFAISLLSVTRVDAYFLIKVADTAT